MCETITLENIGSKTTYEIRQEIDRRGLKIPDNPCYKTLLPVLIEALRMDKEKEEKLLFQRYQEECKAIKDEMIKKREERKSKYINHKVSSTMKT